MELLHYRRDMAPPDGFYVTGFYESTDGIPFAIKYTRNFTTIGPNGPIMQTQHIISLIHNPPRLMRQLTLRGGVDDEFDTDHSDYSGGLFDLNETESSESEIEIPIPKRRRTSVVNMPIWIGSGSNNWLLRISNRG